MEVGKYLDFHSVNNDGLDFSTRLYGDGTAGNLVALPTTSGTLALITDNVASATTAGALTNFTNQSGARYSTDFNTILTTGFFNANGTPTNCPTSYANLIVAKGVDTGLQIAGGFDSDALHFRGWHTSGATFTP